MTATARGLLGHLPVAAGVLFVTLLTFYFPGHTYLQSDTQIYVPMFEHIEDPSVLARDLSATRPHLSFTLYDEATIGLRRLTGAASYKPVLVAQQLVFRTAGTLGVFLLALGMGLPRPSAMLLTAWCSLGAIIAGPAVLAIEYEPVPRAFAVALLLLALGLVMQDRPVWAATACAVAFVYHPPTAVPFWLLLGVWIVWKREYRALIPLAVAVATLLISAGLQPGQMEHQALFGRIDPTLERLQKLRTSYDWVSLWKAIVLWQYPLLFLVCAAAAWRVRLARGKWFLIGLPLLGLASIPASYLFLEVLKWGLIPQFQPARAVLFLEVIAVVLCAAAAIQAERFLERAAWLLLVFAAPQHANLLEMFWPNLTDSLIRRRVLLTLALALATAALLQAAQRRWASPALAALAAGSFFLIPMLGRVQNYPELGGADLDALAAYAREHTPRSAVFLFPDAGKQLYPGMFRAEARRSVYVDWKSGGQMNYYRSLGVEWWKRWRETMASEFQQGDVEKYRALGIDYVVIDAPRRITSAPPEYQNAKFFVYRLSRN